MNEEVKVIAKFWNEFSPRFDEEHATEDLDQWRFALRDLLGEPEGKEVLDIGTGTGFLALMLAELGCNAYGIDVAEDMLALGKEHAKERNVNVDFQVGEGENLPFEDDRFDAIVNARVIWTLLEPQVSFAEWKRVLKPGGKVMSFIRVHDHPEEHDFNCYGELDEKLPLKNASKEKMVEEMEKAGYQNCKAILLPQSVTKADMAPWYAIYGEK